MIQTQTYDTSLIQELTWDDVRKDVQKVDKTLANLIDQISPSKKYKLFKVNYAYGDLILKDGVLQLPVKKDCLLPISDPELDMALKEKLSYNTIPLFLTLHNSNEVFIDTGERIIPLTLFNAGSLLGLFETADQFFSLNSYPKWSVSAGARSIFMLPKISEIGGFKRLRTHYRLPSGMSLYQLSNHWHVFKEIASSSNFSQPWHNEILFFTKEWLTRRDDNASWVAFHRYLFKNAWQQAQFAIGKIELSLGWEPFARAISLRRLKTTQYLSDQVKHLMLIAAGKWPGFRVADNSQQVAPTAGLQQALIDIYQLKQYIPSIMHASLLNRKENQPVYYSLAFPTFLEGAPEYKNASTIMLAIKDLKVLLETLRGVSAENKKFSNEILENIQFDYFHVEPDKHNEIQLSKKILDGDVSFLNELIQFPDRNFCSTSHFWRGCIKLNFGRY